MAWMVRAFDLKVGNSARKLVLLKLADNANDDGVCWPTYQYIADQCEISRRSAMDHIKALEEQGLVKIKHRKGEKGNRSNIYQLNFDGGEKAAPPSKPDNSRGENSALPSEDSAPPSENLALPSEDSALPPSENLAPRTSHSSEPVNESVIEPDAECNSDPVGKSQQLAAAAGEYDSLFNQEQPRGIPMTLDWQPTPRFAELCTAQGVNLNALDAEQQEDLLSEFRSYWHTRPHRPVTQGEWEHKLAQQVKRALVMRQSQQSSKGEKRAAVSGAIMDINDTDW